MKEKDKLLKISHHLWYEFSMFLILIQRLGKGFSPGSIENNVFLESFALHVRNLIDFLYNDKSQSNDVYAGDYFQSKEDWIKMRPKITELLDKSKRRANKEVSHLTYSRIDITPDEKRWHFIEISRDIYKAFDIFVKHVDKELLGSDWNDFLKNRGKSKNV